MISAGFLLKGNGCRIVTLNGSKEDHKRISDRFHKLELSPAPTQDDVEIFVRAIKAFCTDNSVDLITINFRNSNGEHAGGAASFRIEGIILSSSPVPVKQVHPSTISATKRKHSDKKSIRPETVDLGRAYDLAFEGLE